MTQRPRGLSEMTSVFQRGGRYPGAHREGLPALGRSQSSWAISMSPFPHPPHMHGSSYVEGSAWALGLVRLAFWPSGGCYCPHRLGQVTGPPSGNN